MSWTTHPSKSSRRCSTAHWQRTRAKVLTRDDWTCQLHLPGCLTDADQVDHIRSVADGGSDDPDNCRAVCKPCHLKVTSQQAAAARARRGKRKPRPHPADYLSPDYFGDHPGIKR